MPMEEICIPKYLCTAQERTREKTIHTKEYTAAMFYSGLVAIPSIIVHYIVSKFEKEEKSISIQKILSLHLKKLIAG